MPHTWQHFQSLYNRYPRNRYNPHSGMAQRVIASPELQHCLCKPSKGCFETSNFFSHSFFHTKIILFKKCFYSKMSFCHYKEFQSLETSHYLLNNTELSGLRIRGGIWKIYGRFLHLSKSNWTKCQNQNQLLSHHLSRMSKTKLNSLKPKKLCSASSAGFCHTRRLSILS